MRKLALPALLLAAACTTATVPHPSTPPASTTTAAAETTPPCRPGDALINAVLWVQSSAEYKAAALQTYANARKAIDAALSSPSSDKRPSAVILDLDETALDNIRFEGRMVREGHDYTPEGWTRWVSEASADSVPGAAEFLAWARSRGITPFYITNRSAAEEAATRLNLEKLGFPLSDAEDTLLTKGEKTEWNTSDKTPRRDYVASRYRVIAMFGDDLNDFINAATNTAAERDAMIRNTTSKWGSEWFILPNPMYGSWERAAVGSGTPCDVMKKKIEALEQ